MTLSFTRRVLFASVVSVGLAGLPARFALAAPPKSVERNVDRALANGDDFEEPINYDRVPKSARESIDGIRHKEKVLATFRIRRSGVDYYRATVATRRSERVILVNAEGVIRNIEDIRPDEMKALDRRLKSSIEQRRTASPTDFAPEILIKKRQEREVPGVTCPRDDTININHT